MPQDDKPDDSTTRFMGEAIDETTGDHERTEVGSQKEHSADSPGQIRVPIVGPGTLIDKRFYLERLLGQGGMSVVYRALDKVKEALGDPQPHVAIKILRSDLSNNPEAVKALQRETKKMQTLAHPHIVTVHEFGHDEQMGIYFIWMEELEGQSLKELIEKSPNGLPQSNQAISIIMSIADGLEYAHKRGIVHSDLKPSNVFLTESGEVKILDFGIARAMPGSDPDTFDAGSLGALTPAYATAEMFDAKPPSRRDDIYALGLICYELLTGSHPFQGMLVHDEPIKVAEKLNLKPKRIKGLRRRQWRAVASSLSFDRSQRPKNAGAFLRRFRRHSNTALYLVGALLIMSVVLLYEISKEKVQAPETPFQELPVSTRDAFNKAIAEGDAAFQFREINGALHFYEKAYELHPYNPRAVEGLEKIVDAVKSQDEDGSRQQRELKLKSVQILLNYEVFADRADLLELEQSLRESLAQ